MSQATKNSSSVRRIVFAAACFLMLALGMQSSAHAQSGKCGDESDSGAKYEIVRGPDGRKIFRIKTFFCIEGKVPKPSVIYVLNASTINYEWEGMKKDFLPRVVRPTKKAPF